MNLSKRGEYGLRAMIYLATDYEREKIYPIKEISQTQLIPVKYLEQILLSLKNAGLLHSRRGIEGGYYLARSPELIPLGEIVRILDGPIAPIRCVSQMAYEACGCPDEETCGLHLIMQEVRDQIAQIMDHTSLKDVTERVFRQKEAKAGH